MSEDAHGPEFYTPGHHQEQPSSTPYLSNTNHTVQQKPVKESASYTTKRFSERSRIQRVEQAPYIFGWFKPLEQQSDPESLFEVVTGESTAS